MLKLLNGADPLIALSYAIATLSTIATTITVWVVIRRERAKLKK